MGPRGNTCEMQEMGACCCCMRQDGKRGEIGLKSSVITCRESRREFGDGPRGGDAWC